MILIQINIPTLRMRWCYSVQGEKEKDEGKGRERGSEGLAEGDKAEEAEDD